MLDHLAAGEFPPCSLCRGEPAAADSHIVPAALYHDIKTDKQETLLSIPTDPLAHEKRCRTGPKQTGILCRPCEAKYHVYDTWLVEALRGEPVRLPDPAARGLLYLAGADAGRLKLGFMHVLWRAHASNVREFAPVKLTPPQAVRLRELLLAEDPGTEHDFGVLVSKYAPDVDGMHGVMGMPTTFRWKENRARGFEFHLARWRITITCSASGMPMKFRRVALTPGRAVAVLFANDFRKSLLFQKVVGSVTERWGRSDLQ